MVKVRFSGVRKIGENFIEGGFWLKEKIPSRKFFRIEKITQNDYIHRFRMRDEADIDGEFRNYMKAAYAIGERKHILRSKNTNNKRTKTKGSKVSIN